MLRMCYTSLININTTKIEFYVYYRNLFIFNVVAIIRCAALNCYLVNFFIGFTKFLEKYLDNDDRLSSCLISVVLFPPSCYHS